MNASVKTALKYVLLALTVVAGLGPTVSQFAGVLPAAWLATAAHVVSVAGAIQLFLTESPLVQPFLQTKAPESVIAAASKRANELECTKR
jgi:hypothetical protein